MALKRGDAHLEISNTEKDGTVRIEGAKIDVIFSWMQLTAAVADTVKIPLPHLLAECAILGKDFEKLDRLAESFRIEFPDLK